MFLLLACTDYNVSKIEQDPLSLSLDSPSYGEFLGDGAVVVSGQVSPPDAALKINDQSVQPAADGSFSVELEWTDRAMIVYARATRAGEIVKTYVPVFAGEDPRSADPGAVRGLLTPTGLDGLEPMVAETLDAFGIEDQLLGVLPSIETDWIDLVPTSVSSAGAVVDLSAGESAVRADIGWSELAFTSNVVVGDAWFEFPVTVSLGVATVAADATPGLSDDMLTLSLANAEVTLDDVGLDFAGYEIPDWLTELLADPIASLVASLGTWLGDLLLDQVGVLELGGPFAFDLDLMGTQLSARLAEVGASTDGVGLGLTLGYDEDAASELPEGVAALGPTTPDGLDYQLGFGLHEGMFNVLMDELLGDLLDIDLPLEGDYAELLGSGFAALPGGEQLPADRDGFCLALHSGEARVVRMEEGSGAPLARAYLPDLQVDFSVLQEGECVPWLSAVMLLVIDLELDGTEMGADIGVGQVVILDYGATGVSEQEVAAQLGDVVSGLTGLFAGQLSFDLGEGLDLGGLSVTPTIVSVEALDASGLYGVYLDVF